MVIVVFIGKSGNSGIIGKSGIGSHDSDSH